MKKKIYPEFSILKPEYPKNIRFNQNKKNMVELFKEFQKEFIQTFNSHVSFQKITGEVFFTKNGKKVEIENVIEEREFELSFYIKEYLFVKKRVFYITIIYQEPKTVFSSPEYAILMCRTDIGKGINFGNIDDVFKKKIGFEDASEEISNILRNVSDSINKKFNFFVLHPDV